MGDIADMILDGILDEQTGEYIGEAVGYPRTSNSGYYNSINKRKPKRNIKHALKGESVGGLHLVGRVVMVDSIGECVINGYNGKRGRKRYVVMGADGVEHRVKFSRLTLGA